MEIDRRRFLKLKLPEVTGEGPVPLDASAATPLLLLNLGDFLRVEVARRVAGHQRARLAATAVTQSAVVMVVVA